VTLSFFHTRHCSCIYDLNCAYVVCFIHIMCITQIPLSLSASLPLALARACARARALSLSLSRSFSVSLSIYGVGTVNNVNHVAFICALHSYVCCIHTCAAFIFNTYSYVCCIHMCSAFICVALMRVSSFRRERGRIDSATQCIATHWGHATMLWYVIVCTYVSGVRVGKWMSL